ncbi:MAG: class I SAM-dependent methyltransferase [Deltaproteobacteria bacterium]|nr:class I SAM-dependent methyltransferase [Deltaproteobacteria bacterium]
MLHAIDRAHLRAVAATGEMNPMTASDGAEDFLRAFHRDRPGCTSAAIARGRGEHGHSSYASLAALVPSGVRVLDLGCGDGYLLATIRARDPGARLVGLDLSADELAAARARAIPGAALVQGRADALPFVDGAFDGCVSHLAYMLMPEPAALATAIARVLAPGGVFAIVTGGGPLATEDAFSWYLDALRDTPGRAEVPRLGDRRTRDPVTLEAMWRAAGFEAFTWRRDVLDLGGTPDEVWASMATSYEIASASGAQVAEIRARFDAAVAARVAPGARVPCAMVVGIASARRAALTR